MNADFWIPCLGVPLTALFLNVAVRLVRGLPQSALSDLILCFVVFDALVVIQHQEFEKFMRIEWVKHAALGWYGLLLFINAVVWVLSITNIEHKLIMCYEENDTYLTFEGMRLLGISIIVCSMVILVSMMPFAYGA